VSLEGGLALAAQRQGGLAVVDYSDPFLPREVGRRAAGWWIYHAAATETHLYLAAGHGGVLVLRRGECPRPQGR
jgi:hypothetical protein